GGGSLGGWRGHRLRRGAGAEEEKSDARAHPRKSEGAHRAHQPKIAMGGVGRLRPRGRAPKLRRMAFPRIAYGTPRKLPNPKDLEGRVVVLDIAFAAETAGSSFEKVT